MPRCFLSQLIHVELITPKLEESLAFFTRIGGLYLVHREEGRAYLRCWGDHYTYSLILSQGELPGLGHAAWRTWSAEDLEQAVRNIEASGVSGEWVEGSFGHGPAYRFRAPGGHPIELVWEVERYQAPPEWASTYPERPQRFAGGGLEPRQLDHLTVASRDPYGDAEWFRRVLGFRFMCYNGLEDNPDLVVFSMVTTNEKNHDLAFAKDMSPIPGRLHHLAFWVDNRELHQRAADLLLEAGVSLEYGPGIHGMGEQTYLYFREPGGVRIEVNTGGVRNYVPDWEPVRWRPSQGSNTFYRNAAMPDSMLEAFPPADKVAAADLELLPDRQQFNPWGKRGLG
ncbi:MULTISPECIES: VOC family protein [unclassified Meiothermus]|uniref:VOC family protein n=1 Tax=unclassified Meiothermus TaxID=370471 RepID=UPI000D7C2518|nr:MULTISPECIES: VOC family protein [unclassified Meiothermus]PZA08061.1 catechol 1,2-dioxygenase [Meiothermus sp. Pnk-1]RYM34490.1 catechol 1,2-dioxygenase [Meiothermus sp. PNK-Is4]